MESRDHSNLCLRKLSSRSLIHTLLLFVLLTIAPHCFGQTSVAELESKLTLAKTDSEKLLYYDKIFLYYEYSNPDSDIFYVKQGLSLFTTHKYKHGIAEMLSTLGGMYSTQGMLDIARKAGEEALKIYTDLNDKSGIANAHDILGVVAGRGSNYSDATNHFFIALKIYEGINDTNAITDTYIKLGAVKEMSKEPDRALEYYLKGLDLLKNKPVSDISIFLNNNIGDAYVNKGDYQHAMQYLEKALKDSDTPAYAQIHILPLENLGDVYSKMGDTARALSYCEEALAIAEKGNLQEDRAHILITMAELKLRHDPEGGVKLLDGALQTAKRIGERNIQTEVLQSMISYYKMTGNYQQAFLLLDQQKKISDSILSIDKTRTIANLEALYDLDKLNSKVQQLQISEQKQNQKKNAILIVALLLTVLLFVIVFYFWKTKVLNSELSKSELRLKRASLVKNKLISIIAHDLLGSIRFMPMALGLSKDKSIPEQEKNALLNQVELNAIASFETLQNMLDWGKTQIQGITLHQSRFKVNEVAAEVLQFINVAASNKLISVKNNIGDDIEVFADPNHFKFIFRNLLSNAIKYTNKGGAISINAARSADNSLVTFSIKDNEIGISAEKKPEIFEANGTSVIGTENEKGNGIGLSLCREFVVENGGNITVESTEGKGSVFYFSLKAGPVATETSPQNVSL